MAKNENARPPTLGAIMRRLRQRHNWTLKEMSRQSGIPVSTLSKVEHDRLTLTYDKLVELSQRLNISLSDLFADTGPVQPAPITARRSIGTLDQAIRVKTENYDYFYLCTEIRRKRMIPILTRIRAKSLAEFGDYVRHAGEEFVYVLEGKVDVHTEFYDPITLETGQSIYIDSDMGHAYLAADPCDEALVLGVCSGDSEELMQELFNLHEDRSSQMD